MINVNYVTSSSFKKEENEVFLENCCMPDGSKVKDHFKFNLYPLNIPERLEVDLEKMVQHEVREAYYKLKIPCIVEHAGLIFDKYSARNYPGGLTKPLWNTLGDEFLEETNSKGSKVIAKAVVAYCNGKEIKTFIGETPGILADSPKGDRGFYWDTIFIPDAKLNLTYAEIVKEKGLEYKLIHYSQSVRAMLSFLEFIYSNPNDDFWS